uniref:Uncharacterized protein n=1 Tax=Anguilla anguilla TaxID=7936 RepID=A0A0E9XTY8_ANGAN
MGAGQPDMKWVLKMSKRGMLTRMTCSFGGGKIYS